MGPILVCYTFMSLCMIRWNVSLPSSIFFKGVRIQGRYIVLKAINHFSKGYNFLVNFLSSFVLVQQPSGGFLLKSQAETAQENQPVFYCYEEKFPDYSVTFCPKEQEKKVLKGKKKKRKWRASSAHWLFCPIDFIWTSKTSLTVSSRKKSENVVVAQPQRTERIPTKMQL